MAGGVNAIANLQGKVDSNNALVVSLGSGSFGSDTQVIFNDGGSPAGDSGLTFNKTTDGLTVAGLVTTLKVKASAGGSLKLDATDTGSVSLSVDGSSFLTLTNAAGLVAGTLFTASSNIITPTLYGSSAANGDIIIEGTSSATKTTSVVSLQPTGGTVAIGSLSSIGNVNTLGVVGVPVVVGVGRVTAQSAANASISTFTVGAADASFEVSANMNVTASTVLTTTLTCTYTDEAGTARSMIFPVASLAGSFIAAGAITGAGATVWETPVMHIRAQAATAITILTSAGTFTGVTYTAEGVIKQTK